jgi:hypothetical protein
MAIGKSDQDDHYRARQSVAIEQQRDRASEGGAEG